MAKLNKDFYSDLPGMVCVLLDKYITQYGKEEWFPKAWEEYRQHIKRSSMDNMKMPGFVFKKYVKELKHMERYGEYELYHHGILGQKWGVRRFQNTDGTRTAAGKERYGSSARNEYRNRVTELNSNYKTYKQGNDESLSVLKKYRKNMSKEEYDSLSKQLKDDTRSVKKLIDKEKKAAKEAYKQTDEYKARQEKMKKAAIIGAAAVGTALVAYGAYKINQKKIPTSDELSRKIANGKKITEYYAKKMEAADRGYKIYDQLSNDYLQDKRMATLSGNREKAKKFEDKFWKASGKAKQFINISKKASDQLYKYGFELDENEATKKYFSNNPYVVRRK